LIKIGEYNRLKIARTAEFGYFLDAGGTRTSEDVLLPIKSTNNSDLHIGDEVEVFIYLDSKDRPIATMKEPLAKVGDLAYLKVVSTTRIGSFVDFGLERDILVPFKEKLYDLIDGRSYLFYIYLDKTGRIAATTDIDRYLDVAEQYTVGDHIQGTVYGFQTNNSASIAIDNLYKGVILSSEYYTELRHGDVLDLTVIKVYEDGKLGLSLRKAPKEQRLELQDLILEYLNNHNGSMPYNDKSSPEAIKNAFHTSKNNFKNSLGGLMKKGLIIQDENGTKLK
jgi:predicted RNA-binding protein (virulence factor B family)